MNPIVDICRFGEEEIPTTTSLNMAEVFGKRHRDVLRAIKNLECPEEFSQRNFAPATYTDEQGKDRPMYVLTRDAFTLLAMGFTGKEAMRFKIAYIEAFNQMEKKIQKLQDAELKRLAAREAGKLTRRTLTDEIRDSGENERMHGHGYSTYTLLAHKTAIGETIKATRERLGLSKKDSIRDSLSADELHRLEAVEGIEKSLLAVGLRYDAVKAILATVDGQTRAIEG